MPASIVQHFINDRNIWFNTAHVTKNCSDSDNGSKGEFGTEDIAKAHFSGLLSASTKGLLVKRAKRKKKPKPFSYLNWPMKQQKENLCKIV